MKAFWIIVPVASALVGCAGSEEALRPDPGITKVSAYTPHRKRVGVHIPTRALSGPRHVVEPSAEMFAKIFRAMFSNTIPVSALPQASSPAAVDGVIALTDVNVRIGRELIGLDYNVMLFDPSGAQLARFGSTATVHGFSQRSNLREAMRIAAARFMIAFAENENVKAWLAETPPADVTPVDAEAP